MIQHIPGQWEMERCTLDGRRLRLDTDYKKKDANTLEFEITLPERTEKAPATREFKMRYHRRNVRPNVTPVSHPQVIRR
jgi:hypothetical protein